MHRKGISSEIGGIGRRGGFRHHSHKGAGSSPVFRTFNIMPQLDALTYFSQFVYLLISFAAVYAFALNFIIPKVVAALKLRQKLNSIAQVTSKLAHSDEQHNATLYGTHENLLTSNWYACAKLSKTWPTCARILQMGNTLRLKKLFCNYTICNYKQ